MLPFRGVCHNKSLHKCYVVTGLHNLLPATWHKHITISSWEVWSYLQTAFKPFGSCCLLAVLTLPCFNDPGDGFATSLPQLASMASLKDFACKLAASRWSLQNSVCTMWWALYEDCGFSFLNPWHICRYVLTIDSWWIVQFLKISQKWLRVWKYVTPPVPPLHTEVNPPFPNALKRLTRLFCKKQLKVGLFQLDLMQLQIKPDAKKNLHKTSLECFLPRHILMNRKNKSLNEDPPWYIYCTSLAAAVTCHKCLAEQI